MCYYQQHASFGLPVSPVWLSLSQTGSFRSQGKYRATLEFKSCGYAVSNNLYYDSTLSASLHVICSSETSKV